MTLALLADRDADTRLMYAEYLRQQDYEIDEADDGREALAKAISKRPHVIITETRLPGMNGLELCRLLRQDELTREIPIIVVTGDALPAYVKLAESAGADSVLVKPCLPDQLATELKRVLTQSYQLRERARMLRDKIGPQLAHSQALLDRSAAAVKRVMLSHVYDRRDTMTPPSQPPRLMCPDCDRPLTYAKSHIGGVSERQPEQWDHFECRFGCGEFQYRHRTRRVRRIA